MREYNNNIMYNVGAYNNIYYLGFGIIYTKKVRNIHAYMHRFSLKYVKICEQKYILIKFI